MTKTTDPANDGSGLLLPLIPIGAAILLYFIEAGAMRTAAAERSHLILLRDHGATTAGTYASEQHLRENPYGRKVRVGNPRVSYVVNGTEYQGEAETDGPGVNYSVRYSPTDPSTSYCTANSDVLQEIDNKVRGGAMKIVVLWAVAATPAVLGLLWLLLALFGRPAEPAVAFNRPSSPSGGRRNRKRKRSKAR